MPPFSTFSTLIDILLYYYKYVCTTLLWPLRFGWLLVLSLHKEDYLQIFKCVSFWLHGCFGNMEGWELVNRFKYTSSTLLNRLYGEWTHPCWYLFPLEFTLYFPVYGLYCYFWHDCTPVSDSTWCRNIRTLKNIAYPCKHNTWFVLLQYMIECR